MAALLVGCSQAEMSQSAPADGGGYGGSRAVVATEEMAAEAPAPAAPDLAYADAEQANTQAPGAPSLPAGPAPVLYLAYSYQIGIELPAQNLGAVMDRHVEACQNAGPRLCQLIGSNLAGDPESYLNGYVSLRGEPAWLQSFMRGLEAEADAAGGRIESQTTQSEDLTRAIVDTEARLSAQTTLRDRLRELLRNRSGRLADLLETERELARVQAEIDSIQSSLAVMRTRVAMSELTLSYESAPRSVGSDTFEPLRDAFANFLRIVVVGFAAIITLIAGLIPFIVVGVPIVWGLMRWRKARGGRFFGKREATVPETRDGG